MRNVNQPLVSTEYGTPPCCRSASQPRRTTPHPNPAGQPRRTTPPDNSVEPRPSIPCSRPATSAARTTAGRPVRLTQRRRHDAFTARPVVQSHAQSRQAAPSERPRTREDAGPTPPPANPTPAQTAHRRSRGNRGNGRPRHHKAVHARPNGGHPATVCRSER